MSGERRAARFLAAASIGLALVSGSGCWCTYCVWGWANQPLPRSRAAGVVGTPEGGERVLFRLRECTDRPDGWYAFEVPAGCQEKPTRASRWGAHIREIAEPIESLVPIKEGACADRTRRVEKLDFPAVVRWGRSGPAGASPRPTRYGVIDVYHSGEKGGFAAELFGYDDARGRWVHLGGVPLDAGRPGEGRQAAAALVSPVTIVADGVGWFMVFMCALGGGDASISQPGIRRYGVHSQSAVPGLRRRLEDPNPDVRLSVALSLCLLCPLEAPGLVGDLLRQPAFDTKARRWAASFIAGEKKFTGVWFAPFRYSDRRFHTHARSIANAASAAGVEDEIFGDEKLAAGILSLAEALGDEDTAVRRSVADALGRFGPLARGAVPALTDALDDGEPGVRAAAARSLGRLAPYAREAVPALLRASGDESGGVSRAAENALRSIRGATK